MKDSKLIKLLQTLDKKELKAFENYIKNSFFNRDQKCIDLFKLLRKAIDNDYHSDYLQKADFFKKMGLKERKVKFQALNEVINKLTDLLKAYLAHTISSNSPYDFYPDYFLANNLLDKGQKEIAQDVYKKIKLPVFESREHYYQKYLLENLAALLSKRGENTKKKSDNSNFASTLKQFYTFTIITKLQYWCVLVNDNLVGKQASYPDELLKKTIEESNLDYWNDLFMIRLWRSLLILLQNEKENDDSHSPSDFENVKKLLEELEKSNMKMDVKEEILLYTLISNYCTRQELQSGNPTYRKLLFNFDWQVLQERLIQLRGFLHPYYFKNILSRGLKAQLWEETHNYVNKYLDRVKSDFNESIKYFSLGALAFYQKQYDLAEENLKKVKKTDSEYYLDAKAILLRLYYETETMDEQENDFKEGFRSYIRTNKGISKTKKDAYRNFIRLTMHLYNLPDFPTAQKRTKLAHDINNTAPLCNKDWLLAKLQEKIK